MRDRAGLNDPVWTQFLKKWLTVSLILHLIAGIFSHGFYDFDEHFQIIEFVAYKMGKAPASALAHEFFEQARSWFQPTLYEMLARLCSGLGITAPLIWALTFRIFSTLLGWAGLVGIALCAYDWFPCRKYRELSVKLGALLYFLPYLHARTSSENLSGTFFVLAVAIGHLFSDRREVSERTQMPASVALTVGLLLGFSFLSRFQMGFMILGFGIWCFGVAKHSWKNLVLMFSGILATLSLGVLLDWRGGGNWTFAPFNYFVAYNKVVQTHGNEVFPWWYYFHFLAGDVPLLGNLLATAVVFGCFEKPKNALVWSLVPFLLFHFIMAHKEPRYLFPLISLLPILVTLGIELLELKILKGKTIQEYTSLRWAFYGISALNMGGLLVATLKPAAVQPLVQSYVFDHQKEIQTLHFIDSHPFEMIGLPMNFYRPSHLEVAQTSTQKFSEELKKNRVPHWLFYSQYELPSEEPELQKNCQLKYSVFPRYLRSFLFLPGLRISSKASLFKCEASS